MMAPCELFDSAGNRLGLFQPMSDEAAYEGYECPLSDEELKNLSATAERIGIDCLVEVHDENELERALDIGASFIGINNRDLTTMKTDRATTARLRPRIPAGHLVISESGIDRRADIEELERLSVDAALVGESLLRATDLDSKVRELSGR